MSAVRALAGLHKLHHIYKAPDCFGAYFVTYQSHFFTEQLVILIAATAGLPVDVFTWTLGFGTLDTFIKHAGARHARADWRPACARRAREEAAHGVKTHPHAPTLPGVDADASSRAHLLCRTAPSPGSCPSHTIPHTQVPGRAPTSPG